MHHRPQIAAVWREQGIEKPIKTAGAVTLTTHADARKTPIARRGTPTLTAQIFVLCGALRPTTQAIVFECLAPRPKFRRACERRMLHFNDGMIAKVRLDHVAELSESWSAVAQSLSATARAPLFTAE